MIQFIKKITIIIPKNLFLERVFSVRARKLYLSKNKNFLQSRFLFYFSSSWNSLLKFYNIEAKKFHFPKYKKSFFWENIGKFFRVFFICLIFWINYYRSSAVPFFSLPHFHVIIWMLCIFLYDSVSFSMILFAATLTFAFLIFCISYAVFTNNFRSFPTASLSISFIYMFKSNYIGLIATFFLGVNQQV